MLKTLVIPERARNVVIAVAVAAFAAIFTLLYVSNYKQRVRSEQETVGVLVAAKPIEVGTTGRDVIKDGLVRVENLPRRSVVPGSFSTPGQIERLVVAQDLYPGEQVTAQRLVASQAGGVRAKLEGNLRALQVAGDPNQVLAGTLKPGDRVDVVANLKYKVVFGGNEIDRTATRVVRRDLLVLNTSEDGAHVSVAAGDDSAAVQLAVTDAQAQKLFYVMKNGDWTLDLRPAGRAADSPESVETVESVLGDGLRRRQKLQLIGGDIR